MSETTIKFESIQIIEINGFSRKAFNGEYTITKLIDHLVAEWMPSYACGGCGKNEHCKYSTSIPENSLEDKDSPCRFAVAALSNFVINTSSVLFGATNDTKQKYLDSAFFFCKYILESEQLNSILTDQDKFTNYGWNSKVYSALIIPIRDTLNEFSKCLKDIPELFLETPILLVEGQSEMVFIENLRGNGNSFRSWFFIVDSYYGKDSKKPSRIKMLLDKYKKIGYSIYLQGDEDGTGDGSGYDKFKSYISDSYLSQEKIFQFKYDFETAIPKNILFKTLVDFSLLKNVSFKEFDNKTNGKSINESLKEEFGIDTKINSLKKQIAISVGKACFTIDPKDEEKFKQSELGHFITYLNNIK